VIKSESVNTRRGQETTDSELTHHHKANSHTPAMNPPWI
jgi:hypothetical protein